MTKFKRAKSRKYSQKIERKGLTQLAEAIGKNLKRTNERGSHGAQGQTRGANYTNSAHGMV